MRARRNQSGRNSYRRAGFTLVESVMATTILLAVVASVTSAIVAGQQHTHAATTQVAAAFAAEDLLARLSVVPYADLPSWHGHSEAVGAMTDAGGKAMGELYDSVGRSVTVATLLKTTGPLGVRVRGREVVVRAFDSKNRTLAECTRFFVEPQS